MRSRIGRLLGGALLVVLAASATGCASGSGVVYFEPSIPRGDVNIRRVAIVPNRLPLNLQNSEYWTKRNWELLRQEFDQRGFEVVDFDTSVAAFNKGALPVEDTHSSRDKYADLAQALNVDAIVVPYYGTFGSASSFLIATTTNDISVTTLQIYLAEKNDFFARIDASGKWSWTSGLGTVLGMAMAIPGFTLSTQTDSCAQYVSGVGCVPGTKTNDTAVALGWVGIGVMGAGLLADLVVALISDQTKWGAAFAASFREGLKPFFEAFPHPGSGGHVRRPAAVAGGEVGGGAAPAWEGGRFALDVTGPDATDDKRQRCGGTIREAGGLIDPTSGLHATLYLKEDGNRLRVVGPGGEELLSTSLPSSTMNELCLEVLRRVKALPPPTAAPATAVPPEEGGEAPPPSRPRAPTPPPPPPPSDPYATTPPPPPPPRTGPSTKATVEPDEDNIPAATAKPTPPPPPPPPSASAAPARAVTPHVTVVVDGPGASAKATSHCEDMLRGSGAVVESGAPYGITVFLGSTAQDLKVTAAKGVVLSETVEHDKAVEALCLAGLAVINRTLGNAPAAAPATPEAQALPAPPATARSVNLTVEGKYGKGKNADACRKAFIAAGIGIDEASLLQVRVTLDKANRVRVANSPTNVLFDEPIQERPVPAACGVAARLVNTLP